MLGSNARFVQSAHNKNPESSPESLSDFNDNNEGSSNSPAAESGVRPEAPAQPGDKAYHRRRVACAVSGSNLYVRPNTSSSMAETRYRLSQLLFDYPSFT